MRIMGKSDVGKAREMNQDSFYISEENDKIKLFILADGMGGYKGGEIASKLAVVSAKNFITNNFEKIPKEKESCNHGSAGEYRKKNCHPYVIPGKKIKQSVKYCR